MKKAAETILRAKEQNDLNNPSVAVKPLSDLSKEKLDMVTRELVLPSKGLSYGGALPGGKVTIRMMKVSDTKLLFSSIVPQYERLNQLVSRILINCPISVEALLLADKFYIILQSRILSLDSVYKYKISCPSCGYANSLQLDLTGLDIVHLEPDKLEQTVVLPISGRSVVLRQMTTADELASNKYLSSEKARGEKNGIKVGDEELISYTLACQIASISQLEDDMTTKLEFINNMVSKDYEVVQKGIKQMDFGVNIELFSNCTKCNSDMSYTLPFSVEFFRPSIY